MIVERLYEHVDGRWLLTLGRTKNLSIMRFVFLGLASALVFILGGHLMEPVAEQASVSIGNAPFSVLVLSAWLLFLLLAMQRLFTALLPDEVIIRNPDGGLVNRIKIRSFTRLLFWMAYASLGALTIYALGLLENRHA